MADGALDPHADEVRAALLERRIVVVSGELDVPRTSEVAASLMTLDATGDAHVELRLLSCSGALEHALALIDVVDVLGVPVHTIALGGLEGGPVGLLAAGARRLVSRHARLRLREPDVEVAGRASDLERALAAGATRRDAFLVHLARATSRPLADVTEEWARGSILGADDAVTLGYADAVEGAERHPHG